MMQQQQAAMQQQQHPHIALQQQQQWQQQVRHRPHFAADSGPSCHTLTCLCAPCMLYAD
jgi:hypothetical protein